MSLREKRPRNPFGPQSHPWPTRNFGFKGAKDSWHRNPPTHRGTEEIPPPPPKKSCLDRARNALARTAVQIRTGHWRSVVYLRRIRKRQDDKCWARSLSRTSILHCPKDRLRTARVEPWEGNDPGSVRVLLANTRWEKRFLRFLELSGVGRVMANRTDEDGARRWTSGIVWEAEEREGRAWGAHLVTFSFLSLLCKGGFMPRDLRTARR
jgi:hypothetical protein